MPKLIFILPFSQLPASYVDATKKSRSKTLSMPDPGQSYNPAAEAHEALLSRAIEEVEREEEKRRLELEWKKTWDLGAKEARGKGENPIEDLVGLKVGQGEGDDEDLLEQTNEEDEESEIEEEIKEIKRKTKQQKAKAKKLKEEIRARMALKASKRSKSDLQSLRTFKKQLMAVEREKAKLAEKRREAREKRLEEKVGVYKIPKRDEEVQLGEDLAEGLRLLKVRREIVLWNVFVKLNTDKVNNPSPLMQPEGNLLNDRLHSFQKQGIIEPKKRDTLSKRRGSSMRGKKEYETHAYKRFV
jgi:nucleolar protein 53